MPTAQSNQFTKSEGWTTISRDCKINDLSLGPWHYAGTDDNAIHQYLTRVFLKENMSVILFQIFTVCVCGLAMLISVMVYNTYSLFWLSFVAALLSMCFLYSNLQQQRLMRNTIRNKEYSLCDCIAYEFDDRHQDKVCCVKDLSGTILMECNRDQSPKPHQVPYYSYFSNNHFSGKLLRVRRGKQGYHYMFFPDRYLEN